jgi:hypothetical protein
MDELGIVNRALAFLGSHLASSMNDLDKNAARAIAAYPTCRDEVLRMAPWSCCLKRMVLKCTDKQATPWTASHLYRVGDRVTNDSDKTYICVVAGQSEATIGPLGTGSGIVCGGVTWDYVEASTASNNWCHWPSTVYEQDDLVTWDTGKVYACTQGGTSGVATPPVGMGNDIMDGTVLWDYYTTVKSNKTVYSHEYVLPPNCVRLLKIPLLNAVKESDQGVQFIKEGKFIYTDQEDSFALFVRRIDPIEWDPLLQGAVAFRLAAEIAYDVTGQVGLQDRAFKALGGQYTEARQIALNETQEGRPEETAWENV